MAGPKVLVVCLNPTFQKTVVLDTLVENEVNRSAEYYLTLAGKGVNPTRVLLQLGIDAEHLTHIGGIRREQFLQLITRDGIPLISVDSGSEIRTCTTLISRRDKTTTEIVEEPPAVSSGTEELVLQAYREQLPRFDGVIIAGTVAPGYSGDIVPVMVKMAKEAGKMVVLDIKGNDLLNSLKYRPDIFKPNFSEFLKTFLPDADQGEHELDPEYIALVREKMLAIHSEYGSIPVITAGSNPTLFIEDHDIRNMPVHSITPVNTIGSGDAFTAGLASVYFNGGSISAAVARGQECGALNARKILPGTIL